MYGFGTHDDSMGQKEYGGPEHTGGNDDHSEALFNATKGITSDNPYGEDGFFSRVLGIDPSKISYAGNFSPNAAKDLAIRQGIASNQFDKFANPMRDLGQGPGNLRPGVQQAGYQTALGPVMEQYREQPMSEMLARGAFSLLGGGLPGMALSQIGTKEYGIEGTPGFDPDNPRGASGLLGEIGRVFTGGLDPSSVAAEAAQGVQAVQDFFSPDVPTPGVMPVSRPDLSTSLDAARVNYQNTRERLADKYGTVTSMPEAQAYASELVAAENALADVHRNANNKTRVEYGLDPIDYGAKAREKALMSGVFGAEPPIGFPDVNRRRVSVLDDLGMAARQLGENIVAIPGGYMNTETGREYSGAYNPNASARTFTGTRKPQGTEPFTFGSFIQNIVGQ